MTPSWMRGEEKIRQLLDRRALARVSVDRGHVNHLLRKADKRIRSARRVLEDDPGGALQMAYDGARKAVQAILEAQGMRPTTSACHDVLVQAACAQLSDVMEPELRSFDDMRRRRDALIHPGVGAAEISTVEATRAIGAADLLVDKAAMLVTMVDPFEYDPEEPSLTRA